MPTGFWCRPSWQPCEPPRKNSSSVPKPPGSMIIPSQRSFINCFPLMHSFDYMQFRQPGMADFFIHQKIGGITPMALPPRCSILSASNPIRPTRPPPKNKRNITAYHLLRSVVQPFVLISGRRLINWRRRIWRWNALYYYLVRKSESPVQVQKIFYYFGER